MKSITLFELNGLVKSTLQYEMSTAYWVQAEISSLSVAYNGHCYLELVQKSPSGTGFIAKAKANIWNSTFQRLKPFFDPWPPPKSSLNTLSNSTFISSNFCWNCTLMP